MNFLFYTSGRLTDTKSHTGRNEWEDLLPLLSQKITASLAQRCDFKSFDGVCLYMGHRQLALILRTVVVVMGD